jgi:hypothetical protein
MFLVRHLEALKSGYRLRILSAWLAFPLLAAGQQNLPQVFSRVSEEAEVLQQNAPKVVTIERLEQRTVLPPTRFRPRAGATYLASLKPDLRVREIVSEYSFGALREGAAKSLLEFRQVISVDGREVQSPESARHSLSAGIAATDDRGRKRMLEAFAANALGDIATDYSLILLTFSRGSLGNLTIAPLGKEWVGTDAALTFSWQQKTDAGGALEFHGRESAHRALRGTLWVRESDGLPLRVNAWMEHADQARHIIRDDATVEYSMSVHGFVTPVSVVHRHMVDGQITTENLYRYEPFKLFTTSTQIKFGDDVPAPVKK